MKELWQFLIGLCILTLAIAATGLVIVGIAYCVARGFGYGWS